MQSDYGASTGERRQFHEPGQGCKQENGAIRRREAVYRVGLLMAGSCPKQARLSGSYCPLAATSLASASSLPMPRSDAMAANASGLGLALPDSHA